LFVVPLLKVLVPVRDNFLGLANVFLIAEIPLVIDLGRNLEGVLLLPPAFGVVSTSLFPADAAVIP